MSLVSTAVIGLVGVGCVVLSIHMFLNPTYWLQDTWLVEDYHELGDVVTLFTRIGCIPAFLAGIGLLGFVLL